jgi:hypothetical protein
MKYTIELYNETEKKWVRLSGKSGFNEFDSVEEAEEMLSHFLEDLDSECRIVELK